MRDGDPRIVEEFEIPIPEPGTGTVTWHRCVICKQAWKPRTPAVHHERCAIGNLQKIIQRQVGAEVRARRRNAELDRENMGLYRRNVELGRWRTWAKDLIGPLGRTASDAALRFRVEDRIGPGVSITERTLRLQIAALETKLADTLDRDREFDALRREVTKVVDDG